LINPFIKQIVPFTGIVFGKLQGREDLGDLDADGVIVIITCINNVRANRNMYRLECRSLQGRHHFEDLDGGGMIILNGVLNK
jgi:hypothetical protein